MTKARQHEPARRQALTDAKAAISAYARNPCAATERSVEIAVEGIRQQSVLEHRRAGAAGARRPGVKRPSD